MRCCLPARVDGPTRERRRQSGVRAAGWCRAREPEVSARGHQGPGPFGQDLAGIVPPARPLELGDDREVRLPQRQPGTVLRPQPGTDLGIDQSVIVLGRHPRHPTEQPDGSHQADTTGAAISGNCDRLSDRLSERTFVRVC